MELMMKQFTIFGAMEHTVGWEFIGVFQADDTDHALEQAKDAEPQFELYWVGAGEIHRPSPKEKPPRKFKGYVHMNDILFDVPADEASELEIEETFNDAILQKFYAGFDSTVDYGYEEVE